MYCPLTSEGPTEAHRRLDPFCNMLFEVSQTDSPILAANCIQWEEELSRLVAEADTASFEEVPTIPVQPQRQPMGEEVK